MLAKQESAIAIDSVPDAYRIFLEVVTRGSMSQASWSLGIDVSVISRSVATLEHRFGHQLFERHSRGVRLTEAGNLVRTFVESVVGEELQVRRELHDLYDLKAGCLRVACTDSAIAGPLSEVLKTFSVNYPRIQIEIYRLSNREIVTSVQDGDVDVGVGYNLDKPAGIVTMGHYDDHLAAVVPARHPLARNRTASGHDLADYPIGSFPLTSTKGLMFKTFLDRCPDQIRPKLFSNSLEVLKKFCEGGEGISILCEGSVLHEVRQGTFRAVPLAGLQPIKQEICARKDVVGSQVVAAFARELKGHSPFQMA
jgi:DNA-binding transcriptional LysR family regulator